MAKNRKKSNRRYRRGRIYFCVQCGNYSWLAGLLQRQGTYIVEDGKRPDIAKPAGPLNVIGRTCPRCRVSLA